MKTSFFYEKFTIFLVIFVCFAIGQASLVQAKNSGVKISITPNDKQYSTQWHLEKINAPQAWEIKKTSPKIVIAVIDTGVFINHPDLQGNIWINSDEIPNNKIDDDNNGYIDDVNGWDFVNNVADPNPKFKEGFTDIGINHGTIVAGIAAARGNNGQGISGVTWEAQIMPLKVLGDAGEGRVADVIRAIDYAKQNGAHIINLSFVGLSYSSSFEEAIKRAHDAGVIIVAAAGNEDESGNGYSLDVKTMYPVCHDGNQNMIIGVAGVDPIDQKTFFSNYGKSCIDIAAPATGFLGLTVYSPLHSYDNKVFDQYYQGYWAGTSMATPVVSGSLALLKAVNPKLNKAELVEAILSTADNINHVNLGFINQLGAGRLNLLSAMTKVNNDLLNQDYYIVTAPQSNQVSEVKLFDKNNKQVLSFDAYPNFFGGVNVATGDVSGNGQPEIITGSGKSGGPHVRVFNLDGKVIGQFFAYDKNFRGGVNVAVGDIDDDGIAEIIAGAGVGGGPHIRIFDAKGNLKSQFFAYAQNFRGGINVAIGDTDGDGINEIIAGTGAGGGPHIRIFDIKGNLQSQFFGYAKNFRGGVNVATGDIDGDGVDEIIAGAGVGGGPHVRVFNNLGQLKRQFFAFEQSFRGGVNVASEDIDYDGQDEIIASAGPGKYGNGPSVRMFKNGKLYNALHAFGGSIDFGVKTGIVRVKK